MNACLEYNFQYYTRDKLPSHVERVIVSDGCSYKSGTIYHIPDGDFFFLPDTIRHYEILWFIPIDKGPNFPENRKAKPLTPLKFQDPENPTIFHYDH